jgi:hypothetical protein
MMMFDSATLICIYVVEWRSSQAFRITVWPYDRMTMYLIASGEARCASRAWRTMLQIRPGCVSLDIYSLVQQRLHISHSVFPPFPTSFAFYFSFIHSFIHSFAFTFTTLTTTLLPLLPLHLLLLLPLLPLLSSITPHYPWHDKEHWQV